MICPTDPPKKNQKNPEKIPSKGHPRARTLLEFKEKFPDQFFTICKLRRNPFVQIHAPGSSYRYPFTQSSTLSLDVKVMNKLFIITLLKMSKNKRQFCSIFRRILINSPGRDFL